MELRKLTQTDSYEADVTEEIKISLTIRKNADGSQRSVTGNIMKIGSNTPFGFIGTTSDYNHSLNISQGTLLSGTERGLIFSKGYEILETLLSE